MTALEYQRLIESITEEVYLRLGAEDPPWQAESSGGAHIEELVHCGACRVSVHPPSPSVDPQTAGLIDHTLLKPEATRADILKVCDEAIRFGLASVCVNPHWVPLVAEKLHCSTVKVCTVCGFPLGATFPAAKRAEAAESVKLGAQEVDIDRKSTRLNSSHRL